MGFDLKNILGSIGGDAEQDSANNVETPTTTPSKTEKVSGAIDYIFGKAKEGVNIYNDAMKSKQPVEVADHPTPGPAVATADPTVKKAGFDAGMIGKVLIVGLGVTLLVGIFRRS